MQKQKELRKKQKKKPLTPSQHRFQYLINIYANIDHANILFLGWGQ